MARSLVIDEPDGRERSPAGGAAALLTAILLRLVHHRAELSRLPRGVGGALGAFGVDSSFGAGIRMGTNGDLCGGEFEFTHLWFNGAGGRLAA